MFNFFLTLGYMIVCCTKNEVTQVAVNKANPDTILQNVHCSYSCVNDACAVGCLLLKN